MDLLEVRLPQMFNLWKTQYLRQAIKQKAVKQSAAVQSLSCVWLFATPWIAAHQAPLSITISWGSLRLVSIQSVMPSNHFIFCHPLLLLPSIFPRIGVFSNELALHIRWLKYWSFSFNIGPSNKYSGLISFRMDWFDLLAVQGTLKSLLQHHSSKASILQHSVKEESEKVGLKFNQKTKITASGPITSWQIDGETVETVADFIFLGSKIKILEKKGRYYIRINDLNQNIWSPLSHKHDFSSSLSS